MTNLQEKQPQQESEIDSQFPTFSIVYETENLSSVELENIYRSLASLAEQDIPPTQANEFLIIDGGNAPDEVIEELCSTYPWITFRRMPGIGYHESKMMGATLATGEIIVLCDSDCVYEPNWLRKILTPFMQNMDINIVAGDTSTPVRNAYELAVAMHYFFPRFSRQDHPYKTNHYFLNGVAFRRDFLSQHPLPCDLPLYRSNCLLHAYSLCELQGHTIWKQPQAKAVHEPPTMPFIFWRYLLMGRDSVLRERLKPSLRNSQGIADETQLSTEFSKTQKQSIRGFASKLLSFFKVKQIISVFREDPRRLVLLPLAIPFVLIFSLLFYAGRVISYFQPDLLLNLYYERESKPHESTSGALS